MQLSIKVNILLFILSIATLVDRGQCETALSCYDQYYSYCLTEYGECTSNYYDCANSCTYNMDCYSGSQICCSGYCQNTSSCGSKYGSEGLSSSSQTLIIVLPVVFFSLFCICLIVCSIRASRRRAALQNQVTVINQSQQQQLALQMKNAQGLTQLGYGGNPNMDQQMMMQQQMLLMQMQLQQQGGGMMLGAQQNTVLDMNNQMMMINNSKNNNSNNQLMMNQMVYTPQAQPQFISQQANNGLQTYI